MAPEVCRSEGHGEKSDVWSMGCTAIEMVTGHKPWHHKSFDNSMTALFFIATTSEPPPVAPEFHLSPDFHDFLAKCLQIDPQARSTCDQLCDLPWFRRHCEAKDEGDEEDEGDKATLPTATTTLWRLWMENHRPSRLPEALELRHSAPSVVQPLPAARLLLMDESHTTLQSVAVTRSDVLSGAVQGGP